MYAMPTTIREALDLSGMPGARLIAGGTDYFPMAGERPNDAHLVDLTRIEALRGVTRQDGHWRLGAALTWAEIGRADLPPAFDALKAAAREVGSVQIQNSATLGGNLCNASPAADGAPPLLALDAEVEISAPGGVRLVPLNEFITGVRRTSLGAGELLSAVIIPDPPAGAASVFQKLGARRYLVISIAMLAVTIWRGPGATVRGVRIAVGACSPVAQRLTGLESRLVGVDGSALTDPGLVRPEDLSGLSPIADIRGDAAYRLDAVAAMCQRALAAAYEKAA